MKRTGLLAGLFLVLVSGYQAWRWDGQTPSLVWEEAPSRLGADGRISLRLTDQGTGLRRIEVQLFSAGKSHPVLSESHPSPWPWQPPVTDRLLSLPVRDWMETGLLAEGEFRLAVELEDQPNLWWWNQGTFQERAFHLDLTPPQIQILSSQHSIRQGGAEAILYRVSSDTAASGIRVEENLFAGHPLPRRGEGARLCLFALAHDQNPLVPVSLWAVDEAGNRAERAVRIDGRSSRFRQRSIGLTDSLIQTILPEILERVPEASSRKDPLTTFLWINQTLRKMNHETISNLSQRSAGTLLWSEPFLQLSNSKVESLFGDQRTYRYGGHEVDRQSHLGFDLASLAQAPVESANDGVVLLAGYLGIYGNTVAVDHGLGLLSLYGHLSRIDVAEGQKVVRGEPLGLTGQSGLAAGDHLHFSLILQGVPVNPMEWWDPRWVWVHVLSKVSPDGEG